MLLGNLLNQPCGGLRERHLIALPARYGVRSYTDCGREGSLRKRELLPDGTDLSRGHGYSYSRAGSKSSSLVGAFREAAFDFLKLRSSE